MSLFKIFFGGVVIFPAAIAFAEGQDQSLRNAVIDGDIKQVQALIEKGADVKAARENGGTLLMDAAYYGHTEIVKLLLDKGVPADVKTTDDWTALMAAVKGGQVEAVKLLLERGTNLRVKRNVIEGPGFWGLSQEGKNRLRGMVIDNQKESGPNALQLGVCMGHAAVVELLLSKGGEVNSIFFDPPRTPLTFAVEHGDREMMRILLAQKADLNAKDPSGDPALLVAVRQGSTEFVRDLLTAGADVNVQNAAGDTALMLAMQKADEGIAAELLKKKADVQRANNAGLTLLMIVVKTGDVKTVKRLLETGLQVNAEDAAGVTPLMLAVEAGQLPLVEFLLDQGAKVNALDSKEGTSLERAAAANRCDLVRLLLKRGADPKLKAGKETVGSRALRSAADIGKGDAEIARLLLEPGVDPNVPNRGGETAVMHAADYGHDAFIGVLLEHGVDVGVKDHAGKTVFNRARGGWLREVLTWAGFENVVNQVTSQKRVTRGDARAHRLADAARNGDLEMARQLMEEGFYPGDEDELQWPAVVLAAEKGHAAVVSLLVGKEARILDQKAPGGWTALMEAAANGHVETVKVLLEKGASVSTQNRFSKTALNLAEERGRKEVLKLFEQGNVRANNHRAIRKAFMDGNYGEKIEAELTKGTDINSINELGETILFLSIYSGWEDRSRFLITKGADVNFKNRNGQTPLIFAFMNGAKLDFIKFLLENGADPDVEDKQGNTPRKLVSGVADPKAREEIRELMKKKSEAKTGAGAPREKSAP